MGAEGTPLSDGGRGRVDEAGAADAVAGASAPGSGGAARSGVRDGRDRQADGAVGTVASASGSGGGGAGAPSGGTLGGGLGRGTASSPAGLDEGPGGGQSVDGGPGGGWRAEGGSAVGRMADDTSDGLPAEGPADDSLADAQSADDPVANGRADDLPADDPANGIPDRVLPADAPPDGGPPADGSTDDPADGGPPAGAPPNGGSPVDGSADDPADDGPADGGGVSPVVREYVERLRSEALARDAALRARGIDPYKGTPVDEGPRRRLGARAMAALAVLVAAVSVGAYVVFLRGEPDYGMSHGYHVQSDGSLKRPPVTDKAPEQPPEMNKADETGAAAAARYYLNAYSYAWNTGDTGPLKSISDEKCQFCKSESSRIDEFYAHGYWAAKGRTDVLQTQAIEQLPEDEYGSNAYAVQLRIDEHLAEGYTSNGFQEGRIDQTVIKLHVQWDGNAWHVLEGRAKNANDIE